jgi:hypothetical protein
VETKTTVADFGQAMSAKREREEEHDEYANLEIPAFLRRQSN